MMGFVGRQLRRLQKLVLVFPDTVHLYGLKLATYHVYYFAVFRGIDGLREHYGPYWQAYLRRKVYQDRVEQVTEICAPTVEEAPVREKIFSDETFDEYGKWQIENNRENFAPLLSRLAEKTVVFSGLTRRGYVLIAADYVSTSAGIGCLYRLCHELNMRGYPAYCTYSGVTNENLIAPLVSRDIAQALVSQGFVAVYPETVSGNPLNAKYIARWVLNRPGLLGGDRVYDSNELVFNYSDYYGAYIQNDIAGKLYMPTIDESIFHPPSDPHSPRGLACFYVGKSQFKEGFFDRREVFEITRHTPAKSELGKILRAAKILYCFDNSTIFAYEARMCGCPVVIIPDGTQTREDFERSELGLDGIAWGIEELPRVLAETASSEGLIRRYEVAKKEYEEQLQNFIQLTQSYQA